MSNQNTDTLFSQIPTVEGVKTQLVTKTRGDKYIWGIVVLLSLISILVVYSATGSLAYKMYKGNTSVYLFKQISFTLIGLTLIYFLHRVNYSVFSKVATILYIISLPLLAYTLFFGAQINDLGQDFKAMQEGTFQLVTAMDRLSGEIRRTQR